MKPTIKRLLVALAKPASSVLLFLILAAVSIKFYDWYLVKTRGTPTQEDLGNDPWRQLTVYPYTGHHMAANAHHVGPLPSENQEFYSDFDLRSGDHGFFVDFDLEEPPAKGADEFRILLVGGSGAQGWGARTNDDMYYRRLQAHLNEKVSPKTKLRYNVINLAMAGTISFQNYVALNIWGHKLKPDLIISYSGGNDTFMPMYTFSDTWQCYPGIANLNGIPNPEPSEALLWLDRNLPGIAAYTSIKTTFKLRPSYPYQRALYLKQQRYIESRNFKGKDAVFEIAMPTYIHALQSIKRDFRGIPMLVLFQAVDFRRASPFLNDEYIELTEHVQDKLCSYENDKWHFINFHKYWTENKVFDEAVLYYGFHLTNKHHELVARETVAQVPLEFWQRPDDETKKIAQQDTPNVPPDFWSWPMHTNQR